MNLENKNIIIISNEPWGDIWYSKHNYAFELSKKNNVMFVNPPQKWNLFKIFPPPQKISVTDNLSYINYYNIFPSLSIFLFKLNNFFVSKRLNHFLKKKKVENLIFWSFDPLRLYNPKLLSASTIIFHAVDKYHMNRWGEMELYRNTDYFISVSETITKQYLQFNKPTITIPHGISKDEFISDNKDINLKPYSYGLYIGNIDDRIDYELLEKIVNENNVDFVFIGKIFFSKSNKIAEKLFLKDIPKNLMILGPKKFKSLKNYIHYSNFCIAPMSDNVNGNKIAHHKILQYLAHGKPVFSTEFSDYKSIKELLYMNDDYKAFQYSLSNFLKNGEDASLKEKRIEIAKEHLFEKAIKKIEDFIHD